MTSVATSVQVQAVGHEVRLFISGVDSVLSFSPDMAVGLAKQIVKQAGIANYNIEEELQKFLEQNGEQL